MIDAAKNTIAARDAEIAAQKNAIDDLTKQLTLTQANLNEDQEELHAWYRNPLIIIPLSVVVGGFGAAYLLKK